MKEPTEAQIKEFWEERGVKRHNLSEYGRLPNWNYPPIDLNSLFKYAVPFLNKKFGIHIDLYQSTGGWLCDIGLGDFTYEDEDPALALFWALWEVKEKSNEQG